MNLKEMGYKDLRRLAKEKGLWVGSVRPSTVQLKAAIIKYHINRLQLNIGDTIKWKSKWPPRSSYHGPIRGIGEFSGFDENGFVIVRYKTGAPYYKSRPIKIEYDQIIEVLERKK
jgi:hypothetical protein